MKDEDNTAESLTPSLLTTNEVSIPPDSSQALQIEPDTRSPIVVDDLQSLPLKYQRTRLLDLSTIKIGRPTKLNKAIATSIVNGMGNGKTIAEIVDGLAGEGVDITRTTIYRWIDENPTFRDAVTRARSMQAHSWADDSMSILDDNSNDVLDGPKGPVINNAQVHRDKSRVELRLRLAGMYNPLYAMTKEGGGINIQVNNIIDAPKQETRDEWLARQRGLPGPGKTDPKGP
jgi:hypothetical protein